jgi:hypothetical protein
MAGCMHLRICKYGKKPWILPIFCLTGSTGSNGFFFGFIPSRMEGRKHSPLPAEKFSRFVSLVVVDYRLNTIILSTGSSFPRRGMYHFAFHQKRQKMKTMQSCKSCLIQRTYVPTSLNLLQYMMVLKKNELNILRTYQPTN